MRVATRLEYSLRTSPNLKRLCRNIEGWGPISTFRDFDFTPCFEEAAILSGILAIFLLFSLWNIYTLSYKQCRDLNQKSRNILIFKLAVLLAALIASSTNLVLVLFTHQRQIAFLPFFVLEPLALLVSLFVTAKNHYSARHSSTLLLVFWPLYITALLIWGRTAFFTQDDGTDSRTNMALHGAVAGLGLISLVFESLGTEFFDQPTQNVDDTNPEHPLVTANIYETATFGWMTSLMRKGAKQYIVEEDLPRLLESDESAKLGDDLGRALKNHDSLWVALFVAYGGPYLIAGVLKITQDFLAFLQPQLLRWLLAYIAAYQSKNFMGSGVFEGLVIAVLMLVAALAQTVLVNQYFQRCFETGMRIRAGLVTVIYKKALVLSNDERGRSSGDIVNLMSVDATRIQDLCTYGMMILSAPIQITLAFVSLYNLLGWAAFVGVAIMVISIPINAFVANVQKKMQKQQMTFRDKRTRLMSELLANIKSIKLYAWEYAFTRRVSEVRNDDELKMLRKISYTVALTSTLWMGIPSLVSFSSFAAAALFSSKPLTSEIIFPALSLFMLLQFPLAMLGSVTSSVIEAVVSVKRLTEFLHAEELQADARKVAVQDNLKEGDLVLSISNGDFAWAKNAVQPTLEGINIEVKKGELVAVMGRVGSGKTSLLSAIIGDMSRLDGELILSGSVAYASQNPWILSSSVRDNILFNHEFDEEFYNLVIEACALKHDISLLPQGDLTEVGEKGITLSGGQRARVSLARAIYARADLVLLDDVLAAVDSHVARHVFDNVIGPNGLLSTKARMLVTNSVSYLRQYDRLVYLRRGIILDNGSPGDLLRNPDSEVSKLVYGHGNMEGSGSSTPHIPTRSITPEENGEPKLDFSSTEKLNIGSRRSSFLKAVLAKPSMKKTAHEAAVKEHTEQGKVKADVYYEYIKAASRTGCFVFLVMIIGQQAASVGATIVLKNWGEYNREQTKKSDILAYLARYGALSLLSTLLAGGSSIILWSYCALRSARRLHDEMLDAVMHAPLSFFELTPIGRILNLFSRDIYVIDQVLARVIQGLSRTTATCLFIVAIISWSFPPFLIAVIPLGWFYRRVMVYYLATSRELKRLDAVSRSPIFAWFSESLSGLSTIRAFQQQNVFIATNERYIDRNQICYLPSIAVNRWLSLRLDAIGSMIIFISATLAVIGLVTTGVDAGLVGLVLSYALNTTNSLNWVVRSAGEVEQNIVSVERILHYIKLKPEAPMEIEETKPLDSWPSKGEVRFSSYSTRYRPELEPVLRDVSMTIKPAEKVGICGRTGAGKSSLLLALFRIVEPTSGTIFIDGVDITKIGLHTLRSSISIVPQSPDLFEGTLRENIDPLGEHSDADIWIALEQAFLKSYVEELPEGLDAPVREGGSSLSAGQRQLLCFARALLRKSKILVLDEATSAVDLDTDRAIQDIIQGPAFTDVTIFTIAHRLNTIIGSDRVLVLDQGQIRELDDPQTLLADKSSMFYSLAEEAGLTPKETLVA